MTTRTPLPGLDAVKDQARRLRQTLGASGTDVSHSRSLELVAAQYGYRDWNTLHAALGNRQPKGLSIGDRVTGRYLGQNFAGRIVSLAPLGDASGKTRIGLHFDAPVDVVTFDSFSAFRRRIHAVIDEAGRTVEKTSNGRPHLELDMG